MPLFRRDNRKRRTMKERLAAFWKGVVRVSKRVVPVLVLAAVAVGLPYGIFKAYVHVVSSPYFSLKDVEVRGLDHVGEDELLTQIGVAPGMNVFDVDVDRTKALAEEHAWIREARVERRLPDEVSIVVEEQEPVILAVDASDYLLVNADGHAFDALEGGDVGAELLHLPLVTGTSTAQLESEEGRRIMREAMEVVRLYESMNLNDERSLSEVHIDPVMGLSLVTRDGTEVRLGRGKYQKRLIRLRAVFGALAREGRQVDYILIDQEEDLSRVTVGRRNGEGKEAAGVARNDH